MQPSSPLESEGAPSDAGLGVLLIAHGTVDRLEDLAPFLTNIRRGHAPSEELLHEVSRRYQAIGGSPLNSINQRLAQRLEKRLSMPVRLANRLWAPSPKEALEGLANAGVTRVLTVPLAQHSASIYGQSVQTQAAWVPAIKEVQCASNWGQRADLTRAFVETATATLRALPAGANVALVCTAHSLPLSVVEAGDPYDQEVRRSAESVAAGVSALLGEGRAVRHALAFQSQGLSTGGMRWLGPDLRLTMESLSASGTDTIVVAPIGFLADHVEILYDLDVEARGWADALGVRFVRTPSLNDGDAIVEVLAEIVRGLVDAGASSHVSPQAS